MFSPIVLDHVANPRHVGPLAAATHEGVAGVPGEGPYLILQFVVTEGCIRAAGYQTYGCPAAIASGSLTAQILIGRSIEQALQLTTQDLLLLLGGLPEGKEHCPKLAVDALKQAFGKE